MHCDKLREAASLAAEIGFSADRDPNIVRLDDLLAGEIGEQHQKVPNQMIIDEQLAYEKRASAQCTNAHYVSLKKALRDSEVDVFCYSYYEGNPKSIVAYSSIVFGKSDYPCPGNRSVPTSFTFK